MFSATSHRYVAWTNRSAALRSSFAENEKAPHLCEAFAFSGGV
jgi:hypothetical protein